MTQLLLSNYRGILPPTRDLSGSVLQVLDYRAKLVSAMSTKDYGDKNVRGCNPRCVVIVGNSENELQEDAARRSFELFRSSLRDVQIVTFDELFRKVEILAELFSLKLVR